MWVKKLLVVLIALNITLMIIGMGINTTYADLNDGLVAYYPFSGNANDESSNGNYGTVHGATLTEDRLGNANSAYSFDGVEDYIEIFDNDSLDTGTQFTVTAWFKSDDVWKIDPVEGNPRQSIVMYGWDPADGKNNVLQIRDGKLYLVIRGHGGGYEELCGVTTIESNTWYHASVTYDGTTATLYLNGGVEVSQYATMNLNTDSRVSIGRYQNPMHFNIAYYFDGLIDDVRIYNRALSESEIKQLYYGIQITDIKPVQVIEDVPLIKDKATMFRVFVKMEGEEIDPVENAKVIVDTPNGPRESEEMVLYNYKDPATNKTTSYVLPPTEPVTGITSSDIIGWKKKGYESFNLATGNDCYYPRISGEMTFTATLYVDDEEVDSYTADPIVVKELKDDNYVIMFRPISFSISMPSRTYLPNMSTLNFADYIPQYEYMISITPHTDSNSYFYPLKFYTPIQFQKPFLIDEPAVRSIMISDYVFTYFAPYLSLYTWITDSDLGVFILPELLFRHWAPGAYGETPAKGGWLYSNVIFLNEDQDQDTVHVLSHELANTHGIDDEYGLSTPVPLASKGWDVFNNSPKISVNPSNLNDNTNNFYSLMGDRNTRCTWIKKSHYLKLLRDITNGTDPKILILKGQIFKNDIVELDPLYVLEGVPDELESGDYSYECQKFDKDIIANGNFTLYFSEDPSTAEKRASFCFAIPYPEGTKRLILKHNDEIIKEVILSDHSPTVTINSITDLGNNAFRLDWNAFDEDDDSLTYSILYSHNGTKWNMIEFETTTPDFNYIFDVSSLPGGENCYIKIIATDGINTTEVVSDPFQVAKNTPPSVMISPPEGEGVTFELGSDYKLMGYAYDLEDGILDGPSLTWQSNMQGIIGTGGSLSLSVLSLGSHEITLTANDSGGQATTSDSITITIADTLSVDMTLPAGWSMISLPVNPTDKRLNALFPEAVVVYGYDKGKGYVRVGNDDPLEVGRGYWILLNEAKTYPLTGDPIPSYTHPASSDGWAMIGGCTSSAQVLSNGCDIGVIYGYDQGAGYQRVTASQPLEPCKGYWILLNNVAAEAAISVEKVD